MVLTQEHPGWLLVDFSGVRLLISTINYKFLILNIARNSEPEEVGVTR